MKKLLLSAIIVTGGFISCNQNNIEEGAFNQKREVTFASKIVNVSEPKTRASGQTWHAEDSIGIYMLNNTGDVVVENRNNVKYINDKESSEGKDIFKPDNEIIYFPNDDSYVKFMSYYPYTKSITNDIYKVDVSSQTSLPAIDLLYSFDKSTEYNKATVNKIVKLTFDHQLTKININVKPGEELPDDYLDELSVHIEGLNTTADFNLMTGVLDNTENETDISTRGTTAVVGYNSSFEAIVLPEDPTEAKIVFDLNNGDGGNNDMFSWTFKEKMFEKSTEYNYNVIIKRSGIVVEATINPWKDGGISNIEAE